MSKFAVRQRSQDASMAELVVQGGPEREAPKGNFLLPYIQIARVDHWVKNVFVLPGVVVALAMQPSRLHSVSWQTYLLGILAICLVASSNYVINEVLDAPYDRHHPIKHRRPAAAGLVRIKLAYVEWIALMLAGVGLAMTISRPFTYVLVMLWIMGCIYNIPPIRSKDLPYVDVLSEAINNPLRMLAGWYLTGTTLIPPASLLLSYWMVGCYFMAVKRYAELRDINDHGRSSQYRKSFAFYTSERLLVSIMFYAAQAMLFFGAFIMRYRVELILAFPAVALVMSLYLSLAFKPDSAVQRPEGLYREPALVVAVSVCAVVMIVLLFVNIPLLYEIFTPTIPGLLSN